MTIRIHETLRSTDLSKMDSTCLKPEFLRCLMTTPSDRLVSNVRTTFYLAQIHQFHFPMTVNETEYDNAYVCSPYTGVISYPLDELEKIGSRSQRISIRCLSTVLGPLLKFSWINRVVCVNNSMLSTNLYPDWQGLGLDELTEILISKFPQHAILFRSLNKATNPALTKSFQSARYRLVPSRLLYFLNPSDNSIPNKRNNRIDFRWLQETRYTVVRPDEFSDSDDDRIQTLYDQLYLAKYSYHNPRFTAEFIRRLRQTNQFQFNGLRDSSGTLVGVIATLETDDHFTTPIVGYDTRIPQREGLYRLLTTLVIQKSLVQKKLFNMSSGVGKFKKHRGAEPQLEFSAIYTDHLPRRQRMMWQSLEWIMKNIAAPLVQRNEL